MLIILAQRFHVQQTQTVCYVMPILLFVINVRMAFLKMEQWDKTVLLFLKTIPVMLVHVLNVQLMIQMCVLNVCSFMI